MKLKKICKSSKKDFGVNKLICKNKFNEEVKNIIKNSETKSQIKRNILYMNFKEIMNTVLFEKIGKLLHFSLKV